MIIELQQRLKLMRQATWLPLYFISGLAVLVRFPYLTGNGFQGDLGIFQKWISIFRTDGLFHFYQTVTERPYPPISIFLLATSNGDIPSIKLPSVIAEILIILVAYSWLRRQALLRWLIPGLLALHPGLIITTAWWGQNDALFTLAVLLVLVAFNRDRPLIGWVLFGIALVTKQQSVVIAPLVVILSFRRYGWRRTLIGAVLATIIFIGFFLPFIVASDLQTALAPYTVLSGAVSSLSNNAFNLWYAIAKLAGISIHTLDRNPFLAGLSYDQTGLLLLAGYTLIVSSVMWKQFDQRREFIWASALFLGSFTLQTQIHERYLYPASVLALLAIYQDFKMWPLAAGIVLTFTYNLVNQAVPTNWLGLPLVTAAAAALPVALLNIIMLFEMQRMILRPLPLAWGKRLRVGGRVCFRVLRIIAAGLILVIFFTSVGMAVGSYAVARWLGTQAADHTRVAMDEPARYTSVMATGWGHTWEGLNVGDVTVKNSLAWLGDGIHYMLADLTDDGAHYRRQLLDDEATIRLYERQSPLGFGPHLAVFWTFRPDHLLDITFDDSLLLVGYNLQAAEQGTRLLFHWYTRQTTSEPYTAFIHLFDPQTGSLIAQADTPVGGDTHPSNTWRPNELVFETVDLPVVTGPYFIRMGLYQTDRRAVIKDGQGNLIGDHVDLKP